MSNWRPKTFILSIFILFSAVFAHNGNSQQPLLDKNNAKAMIIKFKEDSTIGPNFESILDEDFNLSDYPVSNHLQNLISKYPIKRIETIFKYKQSPEAIKSKFPERSKRIPKGVTVPNLDHVYKVIFKDKLLNIEKISREFAQDEQVEYAQPNYKVSILNDSESRDNLSRGEQIKQIKDMREQLLMLKDQYKVNQDPQLISEMLKISDDRLDAIQYILLSEPNLLSNLIFEPSELKEFPEEIQKKLEEYVTVEGSIEMLVVDNFEEGKSATEYSLFDGKKYFDLYFLGSHPAMKSGQQVRVQGVRIKNKILIQN